MNIYERPVWQLMQEFADEHPGEFRFPELDSWFRVHFPAIRSSTLLAHLQQAGHTMTALSTHHATLEDVFVNLTGRHLRD